MTRSERPGRWERLEFVAESDADPGRLLVNGSTAGWYEIYDDPLLEATVLRLWLDIGRLEPDHRCLVAARLTEELGVFVSSSLEEPRWCTIESNRVLCPRGAVPASALLRLDPRRQPCGRCRWEAVAPDRWFVDELTESFVSGCRRMAVEIDAARVRRFVLDDLARQPECRWWSLHHDGRRSGVVVSGGHEDVVDGRAYVQCVDAIGAHSNHVSCLAAELGVLYGCEVRGEVTVGVDWPRERLVLRRLHGDGWRIRGVTSLFSPRSPDQREGGEPCAPTPYQRSG